MVQLEQLASAHESLVELLRNMPRRALAEIVCAAGGVSSDNIAEIQERTPSVEVSGLARAARKAAADLVLVVHTFDGKLLVIWIFEVQLSWNADKRWIWALLQAAFAAESRTDALVVVVAPSPRLRDRIRKKLMPQVAPPLILLEPDQIKLIDDADEARRRPLETILGAVYHAREDSPFSLRVAGIRAALLALQTLDSASCRRYTVLVMSIAPTAVVQQAMKELRERGELDEGRFETFTEMEREGYSFNHGREEGRDEGRQEGLHIGQLLTLRRALVDILEIRGFAVSVGLRERIETCGDLETLERWYAGARSLAVDAPLDQLFDG
ncbi:hypothetical protein ENSA5_55790 [Enhygromyxa salina]|uniref:DUF4351 domain-containing protein n=1 Tax=Enhygromyxa salina TaxID=215803 RepID=A0A2S9XF24_9BACT|nr:hypothetical protein [Enhygromyxa salina]PRP91462.1 hypothetical protein ENSA5_55790 [Enhygromyxa salina]